MLNLEEMDLTVFPVMQELRSHDRTRSHSIANE